jgi:uncharacterized membrane protein (UPF0127 family)
VISLKQTQAIHEPSGAVIAENVAVARGLWSRFWGLMGRRRLPEGHGLLLAPCSSVHTFFMRFPIDVIFLDREGCVVKLVPSMRPWRTALGGGGKDALELNAGEAVRVGLKAGDKIIFAENSTA